MKPIIRNTRSAFQGGPRVSVAPVDAHHIMDLDALSFENDEYNEDGDNEFIEHLEKSTKVMTDEELKIKALNQAINMAKLLSNVSVDNILEIADKVAVYIKG